jgi:hypothetical protein
MEARSDKPNRLLTQLAEILAVIDPRTAKSHSNRQTAAKSMP